MNSLDLDNLERQHSELLAAVQDLERRINDMGRALSQTRGAETAGIDFETIQHCAKQFTFAHHPLHRREVRPEIAAAYLMILLQLAQLEAGSLTNLLIFVQWIRDQAKIRRKMPELLRNSYSCDKERLFSGLSTDLTRELAEMLLLDLLIGASLNGPPSGDALNFIAETAALLKLDEEAVVAASAAARCALSGKAPAPKERRCLDALPRSCTVYLPESLWRVKLALRGDVRWTCASDCFVKKGQRLGTQRVKARISTLYAPCSGRLFTGTELGKPYGVIGLSRDSRDIVKNWLRQQKEEGIT